MNIRNKIQKFFTFVALFLIAFNSPATMILLDAGEGGTKDSVCVATNPSLCEENAQLQNEGDIRMIKSVSPTDTLGRYKITFEVEGKPYTTSYPVYAVVVFDKSGSMICNPIYGYAQTVSRNGHFRAADNQRIVCYNENNTPTYYRDDYLDSSLLTTTKWNNAIAGAQSFNTTITETLGNNAHVSLITFENTVSQATSNFDAASFTHPVGGTNLADAITAATNKLNNDTRNDANAKKVILVISDGEPNDQTAATNAANTAKNSTNNIEIYAIGYATNTTTSAYLRDNISSYDSSNPDDKHYSDANPDTVTAAVQAIAHEVLAAGTNASIEDTLTANFSFTSDAFTGQSHTFTLSNINETKQTVEFYVDIDQSLPTGIYDTNNTTNSKAELTYTNPVTNQVTHLVLDESPNVIWIKYNVIYHYEELTENGEVIIAEEVVPDSNNSHIGTYGQVISGDLLQSYINTGLSLRDGFEYDDRYTQTPETLSLADNTLHIYYKRKDVNYTVKYYYDEVEDESLRYTGSGKLGSTVGYTHQFKDNYVFDRTSPENGEITISANSEENVIEVYYKRVYTLKIEKEVKKFNEDTVLDPSDSFNFEIRFSKDNQNITGDYQYKLNGVLQTTPLTFTNGVANISLRSTDNIEIINLDKNINYTITETTKEGYVVEVKDLNTTEPNATNVYSNTITNDSTVTFINTYGCILPETGSSYGLIMMIVALFMFGAPILFKVYNFNLDRRYRLASR